MLGHKRPSQSDILKVNTPIIKLLQADPPSEQTLCAIAGHLVATNTPTAKPAFLAAQELLEAIRTGITIPGRVTFLAHYGLDSSDPQCDVLLSDGNISVTLLGGLDEQGAAYLVSEKDRGRFAKAMAQQATVTTSAL